jgi:hypothetical protein
MHRVVLGYDGGLDVHHVDHDTLNNCRANLRVTTRSENARDCKVEVSTGTCSHCAQPYERTIRKGSRMPLYCSDRCQGRAHRRRHPPRHKPVAPVIHERVCAMCSKVYGTKFTRQVYCSVKCKAHAKWKRMVAIDHPAIARARERCRQWHCAKAVGPAPAPAPLRGVRPVWPR